ncbi:MAG: hypothetical protein IPH33_19120 [Bacteroidetes bacterium]|nr:hypothetical protein [Bacteroidota bacterium]
MPPKFTHAYLVLLLLLSTFALRAQEVYVHVNNTDLYDFIDELTNSRIIEVNTTIKPYSRTFIAKKLSEADARRSELNKRQQGDLDFYLKDFNKELKADKNFDKRLDLLYYKDSLFTFSVNPIVGLTYYTNDTGSFYRRYVGGEFYSYVGKNFGFYASLRDIHESRRLSDPAYLNQAEASNYKPDTEGGGDYDEIRGGLTYNWSWGSFGLLKDHFVWGDNYHGSNIFSGHQPSFTHIKFTMKPVKWFDFNYVHGWLVSDVLDSSRSYYNGNQIRVINQSKYVASNMFTFTPLKNWSFSIGNSIIYSDQSVNPAYLIPFFFYKSVDHSQTSSGSNFLGQNSQMFFNISSRAVKKTHLYMSVFIDELAVGRALDPDQQTNFVSLKVGGRVSNILNKNVSVTAEYTRNNPGVYRHYLLTGTFANSSYNMGHYLGENAQEIYLSVSARPIAKLVVEASYTFAQKGQEYNYTGSSKDTTNDGKGLPFIDLVYWESSELGLNARYQILNDCWLSAGVLMSDKTGTTAQLDQYTMPYYKGKKTTISFGANVSF